MPNSCLMGYDETYGKWIPLVCNSDGKLIIDPSEIFEATPTENEHGKAPESSWAYLHENNSSVHHTKTGDNDVLGLLQKGLNASRPAAGTNGQMWYSTDTEKLYYDDGSNWVEIPLGKNIDPFDVWVKPGDFSFSNCILSSKNNFGVLKIRDSLLAQGWVTVRVPLGAVGIDNIYLWYYSESTGNLYFMFRTSQVDLTAGSALNDDNSDSYGVYSNPSGSLQKLRVTGSAYNGITITENDLLGFAFFRDASDAADTYNNDMRLLGVQILFK